MSQATGKLVLHHRSQGACFGTLDGFFLMRCYGEVHPDDLHATLKAHEVVVAYRPAGSISIVAVDSTAVFPSEATRRASAEVTKKTAHQTAAQATIVLGDGFWASAVRGILTTFASMVPAHHPRKVFRHEPEGVAWALEATGEPASKYLELVLASLTELKTGVSAPPTPPPASSPRP